MSEWLLEGGARILWRENTEKEAASQDVGEGLTVQAGGVIGTTPRP